MFTRLKRAYAGLGDDRGDILAAGVAYYAFLAIVPLLGAAVLGYGLVVDPDTVARHIAALADRLPASATDIIGGQLESLVETSGGAKGFGLLIAIALALFGARNAAGSLIRAVALAFGDEAQRSFLRGNLFALLLTLGGIVGAGLVVTVMSASEALVALAPDLSGATAFIGQLVGYGVLAGAATGGAAVLYRRAPHEVTFGWKRVLPGAIIAGIGIVGLTALFDYYVSNFGSYNATYGSLGAVVVLLTWLWLVAYVILFGAEFASAGTE